MAVAKMMEISSESAEGFEDAIRKGLDRANKTLEGVRGAWIKDMKVFYSEGRLTQYRVNMKVSFELRA